MPLEPVKQQPSIASFFGGKGVPKRPRAESAPAAGAVPTAVQRTGLMKVSCSATCCATLAVCLTYNFCLQLNTGSLTFS